jgi:hypothetical protein
MHKYKLHSTLQRYISYLNEAREALYLTLDRLKAPPAAGEPETAAGRDSPLNQQLGESIEEIEGLIAGCDGLAADDGLENGLPSGIATPTIAGTPRRLVSQITSTPNNRSMTSSRMLFAAAGESTLGAGGGREEARPSPERLDAQIRSLTYNQVGLFL